MAASAEPRRALAVAPHWRRRGVFALALALVFAALVATGWAAGRRQGEVTLPPVAPASMALPPPSPAQPVPFAGTPRAPHSPSPGLTERVVVTVDPAWARAVAARTGIPVDAVAAYGRAGLLAEREMPSCHVGWNTVAAIGSVESDHGRVVGGGAPGRVVGPALDGSAGISAIRATPEGVRLHGDRVWEHAVGPMQFLPTSWAIFGADADGDGVADPQSVGDAAWATARHLCDGGRDLRTGAGWTGAVLAYNRSVAYVSTVYEAANRYAG